MAPDDSEDGRVQRIVSVYDTPDAADDDTPSPARALGAAGVTVAVVAAILLGAPLLAAGVLLVALGVAVLTTGDGRPGDRGDRDGRPADDTWSAGVAAHLAAMRRRLAALRPGRGSGSG